MQFALPLLSALTLMIATQPVVAFSGYEYTALVIEAEASSICCRNKMNAALLGQKTNTVVTACRL